MLDPIKKNHAPYSSIASPSGRNQKIMAIPEPGKHEEYLHYAKHCLDMVRIATSRKARIIQREMAAEWFKLADMFSAAGQPAE
jgi:hypothetical protein